MNARLIVGAATVPRLADHVVLKFDRKRGQWLLLAPERLFVLDEPARAVVERCRGEATLAAIADALAADYDAPRERVMADAEALLQDLADKGLVTQ
jgi:pyrroloquinoline quinone biosynthesis protein D